MELKQAVIIDKDIRCPVCNRKHGEITGKEEVKNLQIFCRGRKANENHFFILNIERKVNK